MKSTALSKSWHCERKSIFEKYLSKVDIELNHNFQLLRRYFLRILLKYYVSLTIFSKTISSGNFWGYSSQWLCLYILSSKGTNQLQVLYVKTLANIQGKFLHGCYSAKAAAAKFTPNSSFSGSLQKFWDNI